MVDNDKVLRRMKNAFEGVNLQFYSLDLHSPFATLFFGLIAMAFLVAGLYENCKDGIVL